MANCNVPQLIPVPKAPYEETKLLDNLFAVEGHLEKVEDSVLKKKLALIHEAQFVHTIIDGMKSGVYNRVPDILKAAHESCDTVNRYHSQGYLDHEHVLIYKSILNISLGAKPN